MSRKIWIHYGANAFNPEKMTENSKRLFANKPNGLWASPTNRNAWTWEKFCKSEEFHLERLDKSFKFRVSRKAKILWVHKPEDVEKYTYVEDMGRYKTKRVDIKTIMNNFDGMALIHGKNYMELHYDVFGTWDVDSICIWNPDVIEEEKKQ